jgi:hypothetical protein
VDGFRDKQSVRKAAVPVPGKAARAACQTLVSDGENVGYAQTVDASTGKVLSRTNTIDNAADDPAGGITGGFPSFNGRDNANMNTQRDGDAVRDEHVPLAADRGLVLCPVRGR